jgi:hypothetical protein
VGENAIRSPVYEPGNAGLFLYKALIIIKNIDFLGLICCNETVSQNRILEYTMSGISRLGIVCGLFLLLTACGGGGDAEKPWDVANTDTTTTDETTAATTVVYLGSGSGDSFIPGNLQVALSSLSAGGSTSITATVADADGNLSQDPVTVSFTSACSSQGLASIESPIVVVGGIANTTYTATGCSGDDVITASTTVNENTTTATGTVTVQPANVGSLHFVSTDPDLIGIKGAGLNEVATVQFMVLDTEGNPVFGQDVSFSLNTTIGGITFNPTQATSNLSGIVETYVQSGTIATTVRVTAVLDSNPAIATQSDGLVIATGIPDQNSFSISASVLNPEAWSHDGEEVTISIIASDHFNNPVADRTSVYFTTEGGQIDSQCKTVDGGCSVTWRSSDPRPTDGRVTILATALGEESFTDANANGVLDDPPDAFTDLGEAFRDDDEDGVFDAIEELRELDGNGTYSSADGEYNGALCDLEGDALINAVNVCSSTKNTYVRDSIVLIMSGPASTIAFVDDFGNPISSLECAGESLDTAILVISDLHNQPVPANSVVSVSASNGTLDSASSFTVASTNYDGPLGYGIRVVGDSTPSTGTLTVTVTTPKGLISTNYLTIND